MTRRIPRHPLRIPALLVAAVLLGGLVTACSFRVGGSLDVATELRADGIYTDQDGAAEVDERLLAPAVEAADPPIYLMVEGVSGRASPAERLRFVREDAAAEGTYIGYFLDEPPHQRLVAQSSDLTPNEIATLTLETSGIENANERLAAFIARADRLNGGHLMAPTPPEITFWDRVWPPVMWMIIILACVLLGRFVLRLWEQDRLGRLGWALIRPRPLPNLLGVMPSRALYPDLPPPPDRRKLDLSQVSTESWEESRRAEDATNDIEKRITLFGEALAELPVDLTDTALDPRVRAHAGAALICYEQAKRGLGMDGSAQLRNATAGKWLDDGHHHLGAINAFQAGETPPETPPDLRWEEPKGSTRGWLA